MVRHNKSGQTRPRPCHRIGDIVLTAFLVLPAWMGLVSNSYGEQVGFSVRIQNELRVADVELIQKQGTAYVSLPSLIRQVGGGCTVTPERVQVDLAAKTAWLRLNSGEVSSSLGDFILNHPVIEAGDEALIALSDVVPFFDKAFFIDIRSDNAAARTPERPPPEQPPRRPLPEPAPPVAPPPTPQSSAVPQRPVGRPIQVIILDPGHGGSDTGCQGPAGTKESALTLAVAVKTQKALQTADGSRNVVLTREKDRDLTRRERVVLAESNKGDLIVSLHCGASLAQTAGGFEIFCCNPAPPSPPAHVSPSRPGDAHAARSLKIAVAVAETLAGQTRSKNRGVHSMPCAVLSETPMCGLLIEVGCLTNSAEETMLQTDAYQDKIAQGIAAGITKYLAAEREVKGTP